MGCFSYPPVISSCSGWTEPLVSFYAAVYQDSFMSPTLESSGIVFERKNKCIGEKHCTLCHVLVIITLKCYPGQYAISNVAMRKFRFHFHSMYRMEIVWGKSAASCVPNYHSLRPITWFRNTKSPAEVFTVRRPCWVAMIFDRGDWKALCSQHLFRLEFASHSLQFSLFLIAQLLEQIRTYVFDRNITRRTRN